MIKYLSDGYQNENGEQVPVYVIETAHGEFIHDPYMSTCGRFCCDPSYHGLTDDQVKELIGMNESAGYLWKLP